ncbi:hypothetical protein GCM10007382_00140 [Salinibacterium xinjiangense]|uniref:Mutator family transposase n=1 Tax=Salinibacterium xinjiangense TaxID=386302 RepID=A0A2C9A3R4_9MICO|nr:hypothetical protein GCM10007382_00140 [Salinibacterium xinjiangense]SOE74031.1 Transposase, Mutator family [Salinibacterium xinjiangense]
MRTDQSYPHEGQRTIALDQSALPDLLAELKLTDAEAAAFTAVAPFQRSAERTHRNGTRPGVLSTTAGDLELAIPKMRQGTFLPALAERRRRVDQALFAVVMEAYLHGVSIRKVDDLVKALGADTGTSKSEVSRICVGLDEQVAVFRDRDIASVDYPYVFLDATYCKARVNHRVVSQVVVVTVGVASDGRREVLGFDVGYPENEGFWTGFLRSLKTGYVRVAPSCGQAHRAASVHGEGPWERCSRHDQGSCRPVDDP